MIEFYLDSRSGVAPYLQLIQQVKHALRMGFLQPGDQLPTAREVVAKVVINPNTVFKAYRELEQQGLIESRPGLSTFGQKRLTGPSPATQKALYKDLTQWLDRAFDVGLDAESISALFIDTLQHTKTGQYLSMTDKDQLGHKQRQASVRRI